MSRVTLAPTFISAPRTTVNRDLSKWHSESEGHTGSILARGTANCVLVSLQSLKDLLYDNSTSEQKKSRELDLLRSTLSGVDESYSWKQVKKLLQERVFPQCEKFGIWSSNKERVDRVPNRKVPQQTEESSVLGPQKSSVSRPSPEQESISIVSPISFSAWPSKRLKRE